MRRYLGLSCLVLLGLGGCGGGPLTSEPEMPPPHGGTPIKLPGGQGFVEVVKKPAASKTAPVTGEVTFYFYKDATTPYSPAPSSGTLTTGKKTVNLAAQGDGLTTPAGPPLFSKGEPDGVLAVELDGKSVKIPLGVRE
jgi:hypothetical protein